VGLRVAARLHQAGWTVIGADLAPKYNLKKGTDLEAYYNLDMTDRIKFKEAVADMEERHGPIQGLFCATGLEEDTLEVGFLAASMEQWQQVLDRWLKSSINACAAVGPYMKGRNSGRIILLSADYSKAEGDNVMNATSAGTLHGFAKSFGVEVAKDNVLVNSLYPNVPLDPEKIAATVKFLMESGNYVSAQVISIHGEDQRR